ncbi:MAG: translation initiation factor IF-2 [Clostridiales bacterium]|nr:translation initiation factor IF-2 [Clostridiales bacterium]
MAKIKIYEIAKELNVDNKSIIDAANKIGLAVKSHLSAIEEDEAKKIRDTFTPKAAVKEEKKVKSNNEIARGPVIIRREVIVNEEKATPVKEKPKNNIGFNSARNRSNDYNIVYREKQAKPMSVNELFGIKPKKEEPKKAVTKEEIKKVEDVEKKEIVQNNDFAKKDDRKQLNSANKTFDKNSTSQNKNVNNNRNFRDNRNGDNRSSYDNRNSSDRKSFGNNTRFNKDGNFGDRKPFNNQNGDKKDFVKKPNQFANRAGARDNARDKFTTVSIEEVEKENRRDYSSKIIDKQKAFRNSDDNKKTKSKKGMEEEFNQGKLRDLKSVDRLSNMFGDQEGGMLDYYDLSSGKGKKGKKKLKDGQKSKQKIFELKEITIPENISVKDLAIELKKTSSEVIKKLFDLGIMANINQDLDFDTAYLVADSIGITAKLKEVVKDEDILFDDSDDREEDLLPRAPVVVVMGHVDHGKTSLLDAIRKTNVIGGEAGGITQHIGAYKVKVGQREITFLDTPGHEAFTSMRARGAQITDIAILVVAADDGIKPQTVEAINHAKAAGIPIIVAINKIDLPNANIDKVKQELMTYELVPEEWGGETICCPISAKNNLNIDNLLEMVLLQADILDLKANPDRQSKGTVIEARLDKALGPVASVLVQRGTLNVGDTIVLGSSIGRIRTIKDDKGKAIKAAGPSTPVVITGLKDVPEAGDIFYEVKNEKVAKHLIEKRKLESREKAIANNNVVTLDNLFEKMAIDDMKVFNIILKADVQGTAEAMKASLEKIKNEEVYVKVIHYGVGGVTESDVQLAKAAGAVVIAFNVRPIGMTKSVAEKEQVEIKQYSVIYQALEDVENALKGMLAPVYEEHNIGNAEVRQVFKVSNVGTIAGCFVLDGKVARNAGVRVIRESVVIHDGKLVSLKRFKDDAKEVSKGFECGLQIEEYNDLKEGDIIECYEKVEIKR